MRIDAFIGAVTARSDGRLRDNPIAAGSEEPFPTVMLLAGALRRRWPVWFAAAIAGVILAAGASFLSPPAYSATTTILLRHSSASDPSRAMATDIQLLKTRTVAGDAVRRLGLSMPAKELLSQYRVLGLTDEILRLTVDGPTGAEAIRRADAVAQSFLTFRKDELERQSVVVVDTLEERKRSITDELAAVSDSIAKSTPGTDPKALGDLLARKAVLNEQLGQLRQRIDEAVVDPTSILAKSRVIDPAGLDSRSPAKALVFNLVSGIVGGIALGTGWVVVSELTSERVRRPVDLSGALRTSVPIRVGPLGGRRRRRQYFRRHLSRPNREVAEVVSHLRNSLESHGGAALAVLSLECDGPAAMAVACAAIEYAAQGKSVIIADFSGNSELAKLLGVPPGASSTLRPQGVAAPILVAFPLLQAGGDINSSQPTEALTKPGEDEAEAVLVLAKLDPAVGAWHLMDWTPTAVAMVAKGRCTTTNLRATSQLIQAAGLVLDSAILIGADRKDRSSGVLPMRASLLSTPESLLGPTR